MIVTSSSLEFHCKEVELKDNKMLYVPATFLRSSRRSICILLCEGTVSKFVLAQQSLVQGLFFSICSGDPYKTAWSFGFPRFYLSPSFCQKVANSSVFGSFFFFFPLGCNTVRLITLVSHNKYSNYNANVNFVMLNYLLQGISVLWWVSERRGIIYKIPYYFSDQHSINKIQTKIK